MSHGFAVDLARYGPEARYAPPSLPAARAYCRRFARRQYENFSVASALLPRRLVPHFLSTYAYCRWSDDLADESGGGRRALSLLRRRRHELLSVFEGIPTHPVMIALRDTVERFGLPAQPFLDLLFAFEQDQLVKRYSNFDQLLNYCRYSANPVGRIVLYLFRSFAAERAQLSDDICTALQLTNFWQDVARDYDLGRVYIPEDDMQNFGYAEGDLQAKRFTKSFRELMRFEVERTRTLFVRGRRLVDVLPREVRIDVDLFAAGGLAILGKIERLDYNVWQRRPRLAKWDKATLMVRSVVRRWRQAVWPARPSRYLTT